MPIISAFMDCILMVDFLEKERTTVPNSMMQNKCKCAFFF
jgi:hypothetical protein